MALKTKIVLDADVIIHFIKGNQFALLFDIFPEYDYIVLDVVYNELSYNRQTQHLVDKALTLLSNRFSLNNFNPTGPLRKEYAHLVSRLGRGESACMIYCLENHDVLGSSNLKDIKDYCETNQITYLTTLDFLYYAFIRKKMTAQEVHSFITQVIASGSKLPPTDIHTYTPTCRL